MLFCSGDDNQLVNNDWVMAYVLLVSWPTVEQIFNLSELQSADVVWCSYSAGMIYYYPMVAPWVLGVSSIPRYGMLSTF